VLPAASQARSLPAWAALGPRAHPRRHLPWPLRGHPPGRQARRRPPRWSRPQPEDASHAAAAATSRCRLHPCPPRSRPRRAGRTPGLAWLVAQRARAAAAARTPTRRTGSATDLPRTYATSSAAPASRPPRPSLEPSTARQPPGPPPVLVVRVARPPRPGPHRHRLRGGDGRVRTDGWTPDGWTPHGWTPDGRAPDPLDDDPRCPDSGRLDSRIPDAETGWVDTACWTAATDAVACLLAGSTTARTPERSMAAGRSSGQTPSGASNHQDRSVARTPRHPRCHGWVWPPPRPSAAGGTPPSRWRLGALLSCVGIWMVRGEGNGTTEDEVCGVGSVGRC
jgi:hypothetical protein